MSIPKFTSQIPEKQKAWVVTGKGPVTQVLKFDENFPVPAKLAPGEVLVKVHAAALNPAYVILHFVTFVYLTYVGFAFRGYKSMEVIPNWMSKRPYIAEMDFSGVIVDANGTDLSNGQEVFGLVAHQGKTKQGSLAQYLSVSRSHLTARPSNISALEAAGIALVGLTADYALYELANLQPGQNVFINGGSTAVGILAIQMAKATGCTVTASASTKREAFLKSIGVHHFIDYTKSPVFKQLESDPAKPRYHVFLEAVGNTDVELYTHCAAYLAPDGIFISVGPQPDGWKGVPRLGRYLWETLLRPKVLGGASRKWKVIMVQPKGLEEQLGRIAKLVADGKLKAVVDSVYPFEDALKAYERIMTKRACGKVTVNIDLEAD
ncbi:hypothetical protein EIP86_002277 [Pleurotus ostreatoroseus]|nr:hypothetical protein EIP86_002277 [Pleurotus ostreatoroseus]